MAADIMAVIQNIGVAIDAAGVLVIVIGIAFATVRYVGALRQTSHNPYTAYRQSIGRSILLGLEILVAADIIRTVAVEPTFTSVGVLGIIVLIRTFLSFTLELEVEGRLPWRARRREPDQAISAGSAEATQT